MSARTVIAVVSRCILRQVRVSAKTSTETSSYASAIRRCATSDDVTLMLLLLLLLMMMTICLIGEIFLSGLITAHCS